MRLIDADALKKNGVKYRHITFPEGPHGLSVPNEDWASGNHGEPYTVEQSFALANAIRQGLLEAPEGVAESLTAFLKSGDPEPSNTPKSFPEVLAWPEMADAFLKSL